MGLFSSFTKEFREGQERAQREHDRAMQEINEFLENTRKELIEGTFFRNQLANFNLTSREAKKLVMEFERKGFLSNSNDHIRKIYEDQFGLGLNILVPDTGITSINVQFPNNRCIVECDSEETARYIEEIFREKNAIKSSQEVKTGTGGANTIRSGTNDSSTYVSTRQLGKQSVDEIFKSGDFLWKTSKRDRNSK